MLMLEISTYFMHRLKSKHIHIYDAQDNLCIFKNYIFNSDCKIVQLQNILFIETLYRIVEMEKILN